MAKLYHGSTLLINDDDNVKLTGNQTITGEKTIQNAYLKSKNTTTDGTASSIATSQEYGLYIQDKNNSRIGNFFGGQLANGNIRTYMCACRPVNGTTVYKYAEIQQYPDGTADFNVSTCNNAIAPTPATSDNSTRIATTAYVQSNLSSYQPTSTAVTHTASTAVGSSSQPVYINNSGVATAITYKFWSGTQSAYDSITTKDANTLYIILES